MTNFIERIKQEHMRSAMEESGTLSNELTEFPEREYIYRKALSDIMIYLIASRDKDMIKGNVIKCKKIIEQAINTEVK